MSRNRIYYPKSKVKENLYTDGKKYILENGDEYIGYYHEYDDGQVYTESKYSESRSKILLPYRQSGVLQSANALYESLIGQENYEFPFYHNPTPTEEDYSNGFIERFFLRRKNSRSKSDIIEVTGKQYQSWETSDSGIPNFLYDGVKITWRISGKIKDIVQNEKYIKKILGYGVEDSNKREVFLAERTFRGISDYLTDYLEFYRG